MSQFEGREGLEVVMVGELVQGLVPLTNDQVAHGQDRSRGSREEDKGLRNEAEEGGMVEVEGVGGGEGVHSSHIFASNY